MSEVIKAYPLQWPTGWKRTEPGKRKRAKFRTGSGWITIAKAVDRVLAELRRFGVNSRDDIVLSTNVPVNFSGYPRSDAKQPGDVGVALYFIRKGQHQCIAADLYDYVEDNIAAIAASLEALRAIERHDGAQILDRAFTGFAALPPAPDWRFALLVQAYEQGLKEFE